MKELIFARRVLPLNLQSPYALGYQHAVVKRSAAERKMP